MMSIMRGRTDAKRLLVMLRAALGLVMVVGLLSMCHAGFSIASSVDPGSATTSSSVSPVDGGEAAVLDAPSNDESLVGGGVAGDCALLITCTLALIALGALLLLRASRADRVLWQRVAPVRRVDGISSRRPIVDAFKREPAALVC